MRGLQLPPGLVQSGVYLLTRRNGERLVERTNDIVVRMGRHARTYNDIAEICFWPVPGKELSSLLRAVEDELGELVRPSKGSASVDDRSGRNASATDPYLDRVAWIETHLGGSEGDRLAEVFDQRERTRPLFDQLQRHDVYDRLIALIALFLERLIPAPHTSERRNWVITSLPSTARTTVWRRLICLSVNNVEALTIGEQFDGTRWCVAGFISAAAPSQWSRSVMPGAATRRGAFIAPTYYETVGQGAQIGFDSLDALGPLLDSDTVLDLVGELMMRLVRRGNGMYGRFHDYNLADAVLGLVQTNGEAGTARPAGREGFEPSDAL